LTRIWLFRRPREARRFHHFIFAAAQQVGASSKAAQARDESPQEPEEEQLDGKPPKGAPSKYSQPNKSQQSEPRNASEPQEH